ncbi:MAG: hypothetical protein AAF387_01225 [Pseudomonadota bacterium]
MGFSSAKCAEIPQPGATRQGYALHIIGMQPPESAILVADLILWPQLRPGALDV